MKKTTTLILILLFLFLSNNILAQENIKIDKKTFKTEKSGVAKAMKNIKYGDHFFDENTEGSYLKSLNYYLEANNYNSENPALNYKIGVCYIESIQKKKSLVYFQKAYSKNPNIAGDIKYYLARALHYNYKFEEAIKLYQEYKNEKPDKNKIIDKKIAECKYGIELVKNKVPVMITNVSIINSKYKDYSPLITADGEKLIFTSRRENSTGALLDPYDNQYYEDIYFAKSEDYKWKLPKNIGSPLNSDNHDATVGLSNDGQKLITYSGGDLYISNLRGRNWSKPKALPKTINTKEIESSACFSYDGNTIYFVRGKTASAQSNSEIYYCQKNENDEWGDAKKLSNTINSPYDEDGVFMHPDGKTLYFSSKGHNSIGGYDVFKSEQNEDGSWSEPENLGYPINSPDDDIYFVLTANKKVGYYSAVKDDTKGYNDIYQITFLNGTNNLILNSEDNLIASITNPSSETSIDKSTRLTLVKGAIIDNVTGEPIEAIIEIIDNETNKVVYRTTSNSATGEYLVSLPPGKNYGMAIKKDGYLFHSENFDLVDDEGGYKKVEQNIEMVNIAKNSQITLKNLFFDIGKFEIKDESKSELDRIIEFLTDYPKVKVEISGHTDSQGDEDENMILSENRAKSVVTYLTKNGIEEDRLTSVGYGASTPVADNKTREGRAKNRRVDFKIIEN